MKALPWLRLYTETIDDEKLGLLAFEDRWHFIALLCLKGKGILDSEPDTEMLWRKAALKMGLTVAELEKVVSRLARMKLIDCKTLQPLAWNDRQAQSDSSTERTRKYREKKRAINGKHGGDDAETSQERPSDGLEEDTDTDKEEAKASLSPGEPDDPPAAAESEEKSTGAKLPPCPVDKLIDAYEQALPTLPTVRRSLFKAGRNVAAMRQRWAWVMTAKHERGARAGQPLAMTAEDGVAWFRRYFAYAAESDFLTGASGKWGGCDLAWLMTAGKFESVLSGKYHADAVEAA